MFESRLKSLINISSSVKNFYETVFEKGIGVGCKGYEKTDWNKNVNY